MKKFLGILALAVCTGLVASAALSATTPPKSMKSMKADVNGTEYHHLLMLDVREAGEHAKALHDYAKHHGSRLEHAVVAKHVDEIGKNLDGVQEQLPKVESSVRESEKRSLGPELVRVRDSERVARQNLDELKKAMERDPMDAASIEKGSLAIYNEMSMAREHHMRAMTRRGVRQPEEFAKKK